MCSEKDAALGLPQLGVRFLVPSNSWNVKERQISDLRGRCSRVLSQLVFDNVRSVLFSIGLRTKLQEGNFIFLSLWQLSENNISTATVSL